MRARNPCSKPISIVRELSENNRTIEEILSLVEGTELALNATLGGEVDDRVQQQIERLLPILEEVKSIIDKGSTSDEVFNYIMDSMPTRPS